MQDSDQKQKEQHCDRVYCFWSFSEQKGCEEFLKKAERKNILFHLNLRIHDHIDKSCDEANLTSLVEDVAHILDHDEWLDDPDHEIWELATLAEERRKA